MDSRLAQIDFSMMYSTNDSVNVMRLYIEKFLARAYLVITNT